MFSTGNHESIQYTVVLKKLLLRASMKTSSLTVALLAISLPLSMAVEVMEIHGVPKPEFAVIGEVKSEDDDHTLVVTNTDEAVSVTLMMAGRPPVAWDFPSWVSLQSVVFGADGVLCMIWFDRNGLACPICLMEIRPLPDGEGELVFYDKIADDFTIRRLSELDAQSFEAIGGFTKEAKDVSETHRGKYLRAKIKHSKLEKISWDKAEEIKKDRDARFK